jgi:hypothetical protein
MASTFSKRCAAIGFTLKRRDENQPARFYGVQICVFKTLGPRPVDMDSPPAQ